MPPCSVLVLLALVVAATADKRAFIPGTVVIDSGSCADPCPGICSTQCALPCASPTSLACRE